MTDDTRIWKYRRDASGVVEPKLFPHPDDIPEGEGWLDRHEVPDEVEAEQPAPKRAKKDKDAE